MGGWGSRRAEGWPNSRGSESSWPTGGKSPRARSVARSTGTPTRGSSRSPMSGPSGGRKIAPAPAGKTGSAGGYASRGTARWRVATLMRGFVRRVTAGQPSRQKVAGARAAAEGRRRGALRGPGDTARRGQPVFRPCGFGARPTQPRDGSRLGSVGRRRTRPAP